MALKLIGAVGVKVRPEAENFRDEAERQLKQQLKDDFKAGVKIAPTVDEQALGNDLEKKKKKIRRDLQSELDSMSKGLKFTVPTVNSAQYLNDWKRLKDVYGSSMRDMRAEQDDNKKSLLGYLDTLNEVKRVASSGQKGRNWITDSMQDMRDAQKYAGEFLEYYDGVRNRFEKPFEVSSIVEELKRRTDEINRANFRTPINALKSMAGESEKVQGVLSLLDDEIQKVGAAKIKPEFGEIKGLSESYKDMVRFREEWNQIDENDRKKLAVKLQIDDNNALEKIEDGFEGVQERIASLSSKNLKLLRDRAMDSNSAWLDDLEQEWRRRLSRGRMSTLLNTAAVQRKENAKIEADYQRHLAEIRKADEERDRVERESAEERVRIHAKEMAQIRSQSQDLWGGLQYGLRKSANEAKSILGDLARSKPLGINLDLEKFKARLKSAKQMFRSAVDDMDDSEADIKPTIDESAQRIAWARLKWLARNRIAMIHVKVKRSSLNAAKQALDAALNLTGARTGLNLIKDFSKYIRDLNQHIPALAGIGTAAVAATGGITALVGSVAHLANEFARMAGAALAMPAILAGFAIGLGTMIAVMQDFNRELPQVSQDLNELQDVMSDNFWNQARVPIMDAWNKTFPLFAKGIQETSTALGKWSAAFADAFAVEFDAATFDKMFSNLNKSIDIATEGVDDFVRALAVLGRTGSEYLPRLAEWGNDVMKSFADWIAEAEKTGRLNDIIDTGIEKIQQFGKLIRETGEWLYIMGSAAERAGFSGFQQMADGMERFNESLKSSEGQQVLDDIFQGAAHVADGFKRALGAVGDFVWESSDMLRELGDIVGDMVGDTFEDFFEAFERPKFNQGLIDFFEGIADAVGHISDAAPEISDLLGSIGTLAGTVAENMGDIAGTVAEALGPEVADMLDDLEGPLNRAGDAITDLVEALDDMGAWDVLFDFVSWVVSGTVDDAAEAIEGLAEAITMLTDIFGGGGKDGKKEGFDLEKINNGFETVAGWLNPILGVINAIKGLFSDKSLTLLIAEFFIGIGDAITQYVNLSVNVLMTAWALLKEVWGGFWDWLTGLFDGSGGGDGANGASWTTGDVAGGTSLFDQFGIESWGDTLAQKLSEAREWISETWNGFTSWLSGLFGGGGEEGEGGGNSFVIDIVLNAIDNASDIVTQVKDRALNFAGRIYEAFLEAVDTASDIVTQAKDRALNFARTAYQATLSALDTASDIIIQTRDRALNFANTAYQALLSALDNASNIITQTKDRALDYGNTIVSSTLEAIDYASGVISNVKSALQSIPPLVTTTIRTFRETIGLADGGLVNGGGVQYFANGGMRRNETHTAQIAPAGAMRVWAEPETGGEAYIPLSPQKRTRSEAILSTVADKFGMRLEKYADGSAPSSVIQSGGNTYNINVESVPTDEAEEVSSALMFNLKHMERGGSLAFA